MNEYLPPGYEGIDDLPEFSDSDRQWFFDIYGRFPINNNELEEFVENKLEDLAISSAEELAAEDLLGEL